MNRNNKHQSHNTEEIPVCTCMVSSFTFFCSYSLHICMCTCIVGSAQCSGCMVYGLVLWLPLLKSSHLLLPQRNCVCDNMYLSGGQVDVSSCMH